jgi:hypothetical protein
MIPLLLLLLLEGPNGKPIRSLYDVPGFERLREITDAFSVQIMAHGSVLRRLVSYAYRLHGTDAPILTRPISLFDLISGISDIDLVHSGPPSLTARLHEEILLKIPYAECFRWELRSNQEYSIYARALPYSSIIPVNLLTLSTSSTTGIDDPWQGANDILDGRFRYIRNGFFGRSPLFTAKRDLELFSALMYLRAIVESVTIGGEPFTTYPKEGQLFSEDFLDSQPGFKDAQAVINDASTGVETVTLLQQRAYLRARLLYLAKSLAAAPSASGQLAMVLQKSGLLTFVTGLAEHSLQTLGNRLTSTLTAHSQGQTIVSSAWLQGDRFRLNDNAFFDHNETTVESTLIQLQNAITVDGVPATVQLAAHQRALMVSSPLAIDRGISKSAHSGAPITQGPVRDRFGPCIESEFIYFLIPLSTTSVQMIIQPFSDEDLTALLFVHGGQAEAPSQCTALPVSAAISRWSYQSGFGPTSLHVRVNAWGYFNALSELEAGGEGEQLWLRLVVLGWMYQERSQE